jgi:class 3 adenylate cyclase
METPKKSPQKLSSKKQKLKSLALEVVDTNAVEILRAHNIKINSDPNILDFNHRYRIFVSFLESTINHPFTICSIAILTLYSLISDDCRIALTNSEEADNGFEAAITAIFFVFIAEIIAHCFVNENKYFNWPDTMLRKEDEDLWDSIVRRIQIGSFYFWLDVIATASMTLEMPWLIGSDFMRLHGENAQIASIFRIGARSGRIVRLMRMLKFIKYDKYLNVCYERLKSLCGDEVTSSAIRRKYSFYAKRDGDVPTMDTPMEDTDDTEETQESVVGATMTDLTNRRVIMIVLLLLFVIPLLAVNDLDQSASVQLSFIHTAAYYAYSQSAPRSANLIYNILEIISYQGEEYQNSDISDEKEKIPIISVTTTQILFGSSSSESFTGWTNSSYDGKYIRKSDDLQLSKTTDGFKTTVRYDYRTEEIDAAQQALYTTTFVVFLLVFGTYFFTREVNRLVIDPIELMVALVTKIQNNPLGVDYSKELGEKDGFFEGMETTILLNTINKIGGLMKVGFGEAGAAIIATNLKNNTGGRLNLMSGGRMIHSIFGFCDVRQFTDTTECLQEEVMLFVNRIAHILHSIVVQCSGSANKNIGDAFLLTWKLEDDMGPFQLSSQADQALLTFCKALIELSKYQDFICNFTPAATERLYKRFPGYLVRIGSGLHVGWAIEGAIGSNRKIDASYLSPHVNFTEFLESSTKAYGVPLLISEPFYKLLGAEANKYVRKVDRIKQPGSDPISLYTYDSDLSLNWGEIGRRKAKKEMLRQQKEIGDHTELRDSKKNNAMGKKDRRMSAHGKTLDSDASNQQQLDLEGVEHNDHNDGDRGINDPPVIVITPYVPSVWETDDELIRLRHMAYKNSKFRPTWDTGIAAYIAGDWPTAQHVFTETLAMSNGKCGPSKFLLGEIKAQKGIAPTDWSGYRYES